MDVIEEEVHMINGNIGEPVAAFVTRLCKGMLGLAADQESPGVRRRGPLIPGLAVNKGYPMYSASPTFVLESHG